MSAGTQLPVPLSSVDPTPGTPALICTPPPIRLHSLLSFQSLALPVRKVQAFHSMCNQLTFKVPFCENTNSFERRAPLEGFPAGKQPPEKVPAWRTQRPMLPWAAGPGTRPLAANLSSCPQELLFYRHDICKRGLRRPVLRLQTAAEDKRC